MKQPKNIGRLFFAVCLMIAGVWFFTKVEEFTATTIGLGAVWFVAVIAAFILSQRGLDKEE